MEDTKIMKKTLLNQIFDRHKKISRKCYMTIFSVSDKKSVNKPYSVCHDLHKKDLDFFNTSYEKLNKNNCAVFYQFNLLEGEQRYKDNITKILYVFLDLDDANEEHNELIKVHLNKIGVTYNYNAKSGHGYHFLIPVELEPNMESKVKDFLQYLKSNVCDKIDLAVHTNERLMRVPESWHYKDEEPFKLETYYLKEPTEEEILSNSGLVLKYQEERKKGVKDDVYIKSLKIEDKFFSVILSNTNRWEDYRTYLSNCKEKHDIFFKNLGFFLSQYPDYLTSAKAFINSYQPSRWLPLKGWIKKGEEFKTPILYGKLLVWAKSYDILDWVTMLEQQNKISFLDDFEFYYLDDEREGTETVLYYTDKNYFVQKSYSNILTSISHEFIKQGIDIERVLGLTLLENWEKKTETQQQSAITNALKRKLRKENRLQKVHNINYCPTEDKFITHNNKTFFNTYTSTDTWKHEHKADTYNFPHIEQLIRNLTGNEEKNYTWFIKWLSHIVQTPTQKLPTAVIFQGEPGSGKGTFKNLILDKIFGSNCQEINQSHLESSFNEYLLGKQIIVANEVIHNDNRQTVPNILKNLVTDPEITISRKFKKEIVGKNYTHWIFCTNSDNPIKIDANDRRYAVFFSPKLKGGSKFVTELMGHIDHEIKEFISYLKNVDVKFYEVHEPIMTEAKQDIISINESSFDRFIEQIQQFNSLLEFHVSIFNTSDKYHVSTLGTGEVYILTTDFYLLYNEWCLTQKELGVFSKPNFSRKLRTSGINTETKRIGSNKTSRMYSVNTIELKFITSQQTLS